MQLTPGQNVPWEGHRCTVYLGQAGHRASALLLDAGYRVRPGPGAGPVDGSAPVRDAVEHLAGPPEGISVVLAAVPDTVSRVLVLAQADAASGAGGAEARLVGDAGEVRAEFAPGQAGTVAMIEIYRHGPGWKVRAVGRYFSGGLQQAYAVHGLAGQESGTASATRGPGAAVPPAPEATAPTGQDPLEEHLDLLRRTSMILEDAARSTASWESSLAFAERRHHDELEEIVADPALRMGPAGDAARTTADRRRDELLEQARSSHRADLAQLTEELAQMQPRLPAPMVPWGTPQWRDWQPPTRFQPGFRLGGLGIEHEPGFVMPFILTLPMRRPLWIETGDGHDENASAVLRSALTRVLAAMAVAGPLVTLVDIGGGRGTLGLPEALLDRPPATDTAAAGEALARIIQQLELAELAATSGELDEVAAAHLRPRLLVIADYPTGLDASSVRNLHAFLERGPAVGFQCLVTGSHSEALDLSVLALLRERFFRVPAQPGGDLVDGFAQVEWVFLPDAGPEDPWELARVLDRLASGNPGAAPVD